MNIRGIKSKFKSLITAIEEMQPVITIIEIYLDKKEKLEIEGCNIKTARNSKGGKVLLAFKE